MDTVVILDPVIPYVGPIGGGSFSPKKLVKLEGTISPYAYGFDINLQCGPNTFPHDDIALQISVQLLNGYISLNSKHQGIWGKETRLPNVPIVADKIFKITALCEFSQYKVVINDEHYCIFPQRISCEKISHLSIDGDISIIRISYESICESTSDSTIILNLPSDSPPSYDAGAAMNRNKDIESQNNEIIKGRSSEWCYPIMFCLSVMGIIIAWYFRYKTSLMATLKSGCRTFYIFLCVIGVITVCSYIIYLISQYHGSNSREAEIDNFNKEIKDAIQKMNEKDKYFSDIRRSSNLMFNIN